MARRWSWCNDLSWSSWKSDGNERMGMDIIFWKIKVLDSVHENIRWRRPESWNLLHKGTNTGTLRFEREARSHSQKVIQTFEIEEDHTNGSKTDKHNRTNLYVFPSRLKYLWHDHGRQHATYPHVFTRREFELGHVRGCTGSDLVVRIIQELGHSLSWSTCLLWTRRVGRRILKRSQAV